MFSSSFAVYFSEQTLEFLVSSRRIYWQELLQPAFILSRLSHNSNRGR